MCPGRDRSSGSACPSPKRKGGSGEYSTVSHQGLAVAMDSANTALQQIGGVLSKSVQVPRVKLSGLQ